MSRAFQAAASVSTGLQVRNLLILGSSRRAEAFDPSNLVTGAQTFADAAASNYMLGTDVAAIDARTGLIVVTDRAGAAPPQRIAYADVLSGASARSGPWQLRRTRLERRLAASRGGS